MDVASLLSTPFESFHRYPAQMEMNPLQERGALQEAQLLDIRFDVLRGVAGVLFDLRMALQLRECNTGVLLARDIFSLTWHEEERDTQLKAYVVTDSLPQHNPHFSLHLPMLRESLHIAAQKACFVLGNIPHLPDTPPDYSDGSTASAHTASWNSPFEPRAVSMV